MTAEPLPSEAQPAPAEHEEVRSLQPPEIIPLTHRQEGVRQDIARYLVFAYLTLLAFSIVAPTALLWIPHATMSASSIANARDLMLAMSGTLSGLVGILGFVMGFYFKTQVGSLEKATPKRRSRK